MTSSSTRGRREILIFIQRIPLGQYRAVGRKSLKLKFPTSPSPTPIGSWSVTGIFSIYDVMLNFSLSADSYVLQKDVTSKYANHRLEVHTLSFQEFR